MNLEVIAKNLRDILKINKSNANRIEFCCNLEVDGLTPKRWIIKLAVMISRVPINVMLRPSSESFNYSAKDFKKMLNLAAFLERTKVNGVVFGILNENNEIDINRMQQIIAKIPSKQKTFHKAFDQIEDFKQVLDILKQLKIDAVLTSAGKDINQNILTLKALTASQKITIIGGGGITFNNVEKISSVVNEIHVGTAVRKNNNWNGKIDIKKINQIKKIVEKSAI